MLGILFWLLSSTFGFGGTKNTINKNSKGNTLDLSQGVSTVPAAGTIQSNKINLATKSGSISVNNFLNSPQSNTVEGEKVLILRNTRDYYIFYHPDGNYFDISLFREPYKSNRDIAETDFLKILDIKKEDACKIPVQLGIAGEEDTVNYGLSFCVTGLPLPQK